MTVGEELILGLQTLVLGMVVTFIGLAILQVIMILMGRASDRKRAPAGYTVGDGAETEIRDEITASDDEELTHRGSEFEGRAEDYSEEQVAAIAAVMAILMEEGAAPVHIKSVTQVGPVAANLWGLAGRQDLMSGRSRA